MELDQHSQVAVRACPVMGKWIQPAGPDNVCKGGGDARRVEDVR